MTEGQKKLAIVTATVILAIILLLWSKRTGGNTIVNQGQVPQYNVSIPSLDLPPRDGIAINIPGLPSYTPYQFSPISPCMCNGAAALQPDVSPVSITFVTNEGSAGANIYNYSPTAQQDNIRFV